MVGDSGLVYRCQCVFVSGVVRSISLNPSLERTRTSRSGRSEFVAKWRLVRAAHAGRYAETL
jgi:hypothetical protein